MTSVMYRRVGNLPAEVTSFVGRRREVDAVKRLLTSSRLVTLTGVGGVGKSRLALQVARQVQRAFPDGVWLAELAGLRDPALLTHAVAEVLQLWDRSARPPETVLKEYLADKRLLLVLDDCEHLLDACYELVGSVLPAAPEVQVLVTSREPLGLAGEHTLSVPSLSVPEQNGPDGERPAKGVRHRPEALALFEQRTSAVLPGFTLNQDNEAAVTRVCQRLDGLPLAIELAAVRMRTMSVDQLVAGLEGRHQLLDGGSRDGLPRHHTLRAAIEWSFELCTEQERTLWARMSVFAGPFDLEAAEDVCAGDGLAVDDVLPGVAGLVEKSVLVREGQQGPRARYRLLETIRQFGCERLGDHTDEASLRRRHRDHYLHLAAQTEWFGANQVEWGTRLQLDYADVRAALEYCATEPGEAQAGLRLAVSLLYHWLSSYYLNEGRDWLDRLLAIETTPTPARAEALWVNGWLAVIQADFPTARAMLAKARSLGELLEAPAVLGYVALFSGMVEMFTGDTAVALALYGEALARHQAIHNAHGIAATLIRLSMAYSRLGDSERAVAFGEECVAFCDAAGDIWHKSHALLALGIDVWRQGDAQRATVLERESLRYNRMLDGRLGIALNVEVLALAAVTDHQYERAARLFGVLQALLQSSGVPLIGYTHLAAYRDEYVAKIRHAIGERSYRAKVGEGAELGFEEALTFALDDELIRRPATRRPGPSRLTRRQQQVAELVAQGHTNKEIADLLVIAQRTAESHVETILTKLGFTSRAQIAAWVADQQAAP
ncbi:LuxR C-terminal-related transcriptional regulator [Saccharomonospora sp. NPDC046836]|uniref:ATP-binding protein n=1 Tax=Saccharomonospora sp. NPDC046836 TaxID=3156921 RepID=UPI0034102A1E